MFGTVIDTGSGKVAENGTIVSLDVTQGDRIIYNRNAGTPVTVDGEDFLILTEEDILAIAQG
jgi:chaperonin GroES